VWDSRGWFLGLAERWQVEFSVFLIGIIVVVVIVVFGLIEQENLVGGFEFAAVGCDCLVN